MDVSTCVCVCMYVCVCMCACKYVCVYACMYVCVCMHVCMCVLCVHVYVCVCVYVCMSLGSKHLFTNICQISLQITLTYPQRHASNFLLVKKERCFKLNCVYSRQAKAGKQVIIPSAGMQINAKMYMYKQIIGPDLQYEIPKLSPAKKNSGSRGMRHSLTI